MHDDAKDGKKRNLYVFEAAAELSTSIVLRLTTNTVTLRTQKF